MTDITTLSKHKHIYHIYEDGAGEIHCTKHPIIYLNSKVVYFKDARKQEYISNILVSKISDNLTTFIKGIRGDIGWRKVDNYFWDREDDLRGLFNEFKRERQREKLIQNEKQTISRYLKAKEEFEKAERELKRIAEVKENQNV